jgi:hypothetical protein
MIPEMRLIHFLATVKRYDGLQKVRKMRNKENMG